MKPEMIRRFMAAARAAGLDEEGIRHLIHTYTGGRTQSRRELTDREAVDLVARLKLQKQQQWTPPPGDSMRKKIISMAREMGWEIDTPLGRKADMPRINAWCEKYSFGKKKLNAYTVQELPRVVSQFEILYIHTIDQ